MTTIHHATKARAEKAGIVLEVVQNDEVRALHMASGRHVIAAEPKTALAGALLAARLIGEYPRIVIFVEDDAIAAKIDSTQETFWTQDEDEKYDEDAAFAAILEAYAELDLPEDEDDGEKETGGNVVPVKYRQMYAERGNAAHCGDFLAKLLDGRFEAKPAEGEKGDAYFDAGAFELFLRANGVPVEGKWATLPQSGQKGWQGRYRMNGRQLLEKYVAKSGVVVLGSETIAVPEADLAELRAKHAKWLEREAKKETKAAEPVEAEQTAEPAPKARKARAKKEAAAA